MSHSDISSRMCRCCADPEHQGQGDRHVDLGLQVFCGTGSDISHKFRRICAFVIYGWNSRFYEKIQYILMWYIDRDTGRNP